MTAWSKIWRCASRQGAGGHYLTGARTDINDAVHSYGGVVMHDIINNKFARKAIEKELTA